MNELFCVIGSMQQSMSNFNFLVLQRSGNWQEEPTLDDHWKPNLHKTKPHQGSHYPILVSLKDTILVDCGCLRREDELELPGHYGIVFRARCSPYTFVSQPSFP